MTQNVNNVSDVLTKGKIGGGATGGIGAVGDDVGTVDGIKEGAFELVGLSVMAMVGTDDGISDGISEGDTVVGDCVGDIAGMDPVELTPVKSNPLSLSPAVISSPDVEDSDDEVF